MIEYTYTHTHTHIHTHTHTHTRARTRPPPPYLSPCVFGAVRVNQPEEDSLVLSLGWCVPMYFHNTPLGSAFQDWTYDDTNKARLRSIVAVGALA